MYYTYAMGMNEKIYELESQGFKIKKRNKSFEVIFPKEKAQIWEDFVKDNLEINYWNEYLTEDKVLTICEELCDWDFGSIKEMLLGNKFYKKILSKKCGKSFENSLFKLS